MKFTTTPTNIVILLLVAGVVFYIGFIFGKRRSAEAFTDVSAAAVAAGGVTCDRCAKPRPCPCPAPPTPERPKCPPCPNCPEPDPAKWVLKASVPPCPPMPDMSKYMLKTECPPLPDMSKYVLKSSVPQCPPCISTCSKPCKIGECPPCPRPRCPVVKCPEPKACPACPAAMCAPCPEPNIKCKADYAPGTPVRPMLASTSTFGF